MGAVNTTYTFTATDTITSTKMNNIIDQTTMTSDAVFTGGTIEVVSGKLRVAAGKITSNELASNSVNTDEIVNLAVTTAKLANSTSTTTGVTTAKIADGAITTAKIADSSSTTTGVTTAKIADESITAPKLSGSQTGSAPIFGCRAWVVFDMTRNASGGSDTLNTNRFIYSSGNVDSVTKIDTGRFQVNFTTAMPDANYMYFGSGRSNTGDNSGDVIIGRPNSTGSADGAKTTSSIKLDVIDAGASFFNSSEVCVSIIG